MTVRLKIGSAKLAHYRPAKPMSNSLENRKLSALTVIVGHESHRPLTLTANSTSTWFKTWGFHLYAAKNVEIRTFVNHALVVHWLYDKYHEPNPIFSISNLIFKQIKFRNVFGLYFYAWKHAEFWWESELFCHIKKCSINCNQIRSSTRLYPIKSVCWK